MENRQYFDKIYKQYYRKCLLFARSYTHDLSQAEDIVTEAMIVLWEKLESGEPVEQVLPFLFGIIRNKILQYFRREMFKCRLHADLEDEGMREMQLRLSTLEDCDPHELYFMDAQKLLKDSLASMHAQTREIFMLSRFEGKTNREIAEAMGISPKGIEYHISKALKQLRRDLKDIHPLLLELMI